jgi:hypothetical protein
MHLFAKQVWHGILAGLLLTCAPPDQELTLFKWWRKAKQGTPKLMRKGLRSITDPLDDLETLKQLHVPGDTTLPQSTNLTHQGGG